MPTKCQYDFNEEQKFWRTKTADRATEILRDPNFVQIKVPDLFESLATAGWQFPNIEFALRYLPLAHDGAHHAYLRKLAARHIKSISSQLPKVIPQVLEMMDSRFQQDGEVELMSEVVFPMVGEIVKVLSGLEYDRDTSLAIWNEFSLRKLKHQDQNFGKLKATAEKLFPDASPEEIGTRISLVTVGLEPLAGTLGSSFSCIFEGAKAGRICDLNWPENIPATGIPRVVRTTADDGEIDLGNGAKGIRTLSLDLTTYLDLTDTQAQLGIFGTGSHSCIGRAISTLLWKGVVEKMKENKAIITYLGQSPSTHNIFNVPNELRVKISHDT